MKEFLELTIEEKEKELYELKRLMALKTEVAALNRLNVHVVIKGIEMYIHFKDTSIHATMSATNMKDTIEFVKDCFVQADSVDFYITGYGDKGTEGDAIGNVLKINKNYEVHRLRDVESRL